MNPIYFTIMTLLTGLIYTSSAQADDVCLKTLNVGDTLADAWNLHCQSTHRTNTNDPYNPKPYHAKFYTFTLDREADIQANINNGFDNRFYLLDGNTTTGAILQEFSGRSFEAYLPIGTYTLETTSEHNFSYTINLAFNDLGNTSVRSIDDSWHTGL